MCVKSHNRNYSVLSHHEICLTSPVLLVNPVLLIKSVLHVIQCYVLSSAALEKFRWFEVMQRSNEVTVKYCSNAGHILSVESNQNVESK